MKPAAVSKRTPIATVGRYPVTVNVYAIEVRGEPVARVEWRELGARKTKQFHGAKRDRENMAKAFAQGTVDRLQGVAVVAPRRVTVADLWDAYLTANAPDWRPKTIILAKARWKAFALHTDPMTYADLIQPAHLDGFRKMLLEVDTKRGVPMARNQVAHHIQLVKAVWRFARQRQMLRENPLAEYAVKKGRDYEAMKVAEFTPGDWAKILGALNYRTSHGWRPWAAIALDGLLAPRSRAMLNLRWSDVDLTARAVTWRGELDKVGRTRVQPLPRDAVRVLRICKAWGMREGGGSPYVFPGRQLRTTGKPWTYSALNDALHKATRRAGLEPVKFRAMHGLRRMVAGNVLSLTGDITKVGLWLGDTDVRVMQRSYLRDRPEDAAAMVAGTVLPTSGKQHRKQDIDKSGNQTATGAVGAPVGKTIKR